MAAFQRIFRHVSAGAVVAAALALAPAASARTWLAPANPGTPALGPARARGAVVWSHGRSVHSEDYTAPTPSYMAILREDGWDTFRFNRTRSSDTLPYSAAVLEGIARKLKQKGYHKVVLTGQSYGGFLALMAADATKSIDAVVVTAPAAYGSFTDYYGSWRENATQLYPLLQRIERARVMMFFFHGDDFDPGGRGGRSRRILTERHIPNVIVDQPPQLTTHWAASTPLFTERFAECIANFLDAPAIPADARCRDDTLWAGNAPAASEQAFVGDSAVRTR